ncbi:hypothetical protein ACKJPP_11005 [Neisseria polysaccharea]
MVWVLVDGEGLGMIGRLKKWLIGLDGTPQSNETVWFSQIVFFRRL